MELEQVYKGVSACLTSSCGLEEDEISLESTLSHDLDIDSIDLIDLLYELERKFSIQITIGEFEQEARKETGDEQFEVDTVLTPAGVKTLKRLMPEVGDDKFVEGLTVQQIPRLFTVHSICNLVM